MTKEAKDQVRMTIWLPREQVKALKLIAIHEEEDLSELVEKALEDFMTARFSEEAVKDLRQATTLGEIKAIFGDYVKP